MPEGKANTPKKGKAELIRVLPNGVLSRSEVDSAPLSPRYGLHAAAFTCSEQACRGSS